MRRLPQEGSAALATSCDPAPGSDAESNLVEYSGYDVEATINLMKSRSTTSGTVSALHKELDDIKKIKLSANELAELVSELLS